MLELALGRQAACNSPQRELAEVGQTSVPNGPHRLLAVKKTSEERHDRRKGVTLVSWYRPYLRSAKSTDCTNARIKYAEAGESAV